MHRRCLVCHAIGESGRPKPCRHGQWSPPIPQEWRCRYCDKRVQCLLAPGVCDECGNAAWAHVIDRTLNTKPPETHATPALPLTFVLFPMEQRMSPLDRYHQHQTPKRRAPKTVRPPDTTAAVRNVTRLPGDLSREEIDSIISSELARIKYERAIGRPRFQSESHRRDGSVEAKATAPKGQYMEHVKVWPHVCACGGTIDHSSQRWWCNQCDASGEPEWRDVYAPICPPQFDSGLEHRIDLTTAKEDREFRESLGAIGVLLETNWPYGRLRPRVRRWNDGKKRAFQPKVERYSDRYAIGRP